MSVLGALGVRVGHRRSHTQNGIEEKSDADHHADHGKPFLCLIVWKDIAVSGGGCRQCGPVEAAR